MPNYYIWNSHGEIEIDYHSTIPPTLDGQQENQPSQYVDMVLDIAGPSFRHNYNNGVEEMPNPSAREFYDILQAAQQPLWEGCKEVSKLSAALELLSIKATTNMSQQCYNLVSKFMRRTQPADTLMPTNLYQTKKLVSKLGLSYKKIDCCENGCMLYYKSDDSATQCKFCLEERYSSESLGRKKKVARKQLWFLPLIPRLQRLYASQKTAKAMRWHYENRRSVNVLSHPSDGEAWRVFDSTYPNFANDPRNVRLGLCTDGFVPSGQYGKKHSC